MAECQVLDDLGSACGDCGDELICDGETHECRGCGAAFDCPEA